jgi:hypothetical protein
MLVKNFVYLVYFQLTIMFFSKQLSKAADKWKRDKWEKQKVIDKKINWKKDHRDTEKEMKERQRDEYFFFFLQVKDWKIPCLRRLFHIQ